MTMIFGIPLQAFLGQLLIGLINGSFYAMLSLGLAVIFGLLRIINFAHGAQYMLGAFAGYLLLAYGGIGFWPSLVLAPLIGLAAGFWFQDWRIGAVIVGLGLLGAAEADAAVDSQQLPVAAVDIQVEAALPRPAERDEGQIAIVKIHVS